MVSKKKNIRLDDQKDTAMQNPTINISLVTQSREDVVIPTMQSPIVSNFISINTPNRIMSPTPIGSKKLVTDLDIAKAIGTHEK